VKDLIDKPISNSSEDQLGFQFVADSLLDAIVAQPNHSSLTLGLDGAWGAGKSSILAMMMNAVDDKRSKEGIGTVVITFSPWLIRDQEALIASLFDQLQSAIREAEKQTPPTWKKAKKSIGKELKKAKCLLNRFCAATASLTEAVSTVDSTHITKLISYLSRWLQAWTKAPPVKATLEELKGQLVNVLAEIAKQDKTFRVVVLVDDIDRLEPKEALEVLRLIKAVANFPAITYVLAYDRKTLAKAISKSAGVDDGDAYLEKIIQYSFKVPPLEPFQLRNWLCVELQEAAPNSIDMSSMRAAAVLDSWAGRLLQTPRDVKRLMFAVRATWAKLEGRVDLLDLIWLQMVALKAAEGDRNLYGWLVKYLQAVDAIAIGGTISGQQQDRDELGKILKKLGWKEHKGDADSSSVDFHWLNRILAGVNASYLGGLEKNWTHDVNEQKLQEYRSEQRLSSPWHWRLYFAFHEPTHAITDAEWRVLQEASIMSIEILIGAINKILDVRDSERKDAADQIVERVRYEAASGRLERSEHWLLAVIKSAAVMQERSKLDRLFGMTKLFGNKLTGLMKVIINELTGDVRQKTLDLIFKDQGNVGIAAALFKDQLFASEKQKHEKERLFYLTDNELEDVKVQQLELYRGLNWQQLIRTSSPYDVLYAWKKADPTDSGVRDIFMPAFGKREDLVEMIEALRCVSSSAQKGVPHVPESMLKNFIDAQAVKQQLKEIALGNDEVSERSRALLDVWCEDRDF